MRTYVTFKFAGTDNVRAECQLPEDVTEPNVSNVLELGSSDGIGYKGFQLSDVDGAVVSTLSGQYFFYPEDGYPGYISSKLSDRNCEITEYLYVRFDGSDTEIRQAYLYLTFDRVCGEYAKSFQVYGPNGSKRFDEDQTEGVYTYVLPLSNFVSHDSDTLTIKIFKWNKPNASVKIARLSTKVEETYSGKDLVSFVCSENELDAHLAIQPGICEQYTDIEFCDRDRLIRQLANLNLLDACEAQLWCAHEQNTTLLGRYVASCWNLQANHHRVVFEGTDESVRFADINLPASDIRDRTLVQMLDEVFGIAGAPWQAATDKTQRILEDTLTPNCWFKAGTLRERLDKICLLGFLRVYYDKGTFYVRSFLET